MNALASTSSDLATTVSALKVAGEELRQATTTKTKIDAMFKFGTELNAIHDLGQDQLKFWSCVCSFRLWEAIIDVLTEAPEVADCKQHENEIVLRFLCTISAGKLVFACETYLRDHSATAYLSARLPKVLQHQAWLSINTRQWKDVLHQMRQGTIHLIRLVLLYDQTSGVKHAIVKRLDHDMYLSLLFSHILDPHTYTEKRGDEFLADVVEVLMALGLDNRLSGRAASWAAAEFGPSFVSTGFFKFSQLIIEKDRETYCFAPVELAAHLLASEDNHDYMVDRQRVPLFCINMYWSLVKKYDTIDGMATMEFSSAIARFIHVVLDVVKDPRRQTTIICDLVKEADLVILLGRMWLNSWGPNNESIVAAIGKQVATFAAQDSSLTQQYIKPAWVHVQKCLESHIRVKEPSQQLPSRVLDQWTGNLGRHLGWVAASDAFLLRNDPRELKLVGCSWIRCPLYGEPTRLPAKTPFHMSRCRRCSKVQYCCLACQKSDWCLGDHRKKCGERKASQIRDLTSWKSIASEGHYNWASDQRSSLRHRQ